MDTGHEQKYYQVKDQRYLGGDEFVEKVEGLNGLGSGLAWGQACNIAI
jgi:hypothetical protein